MTRYSKLSVGQGKIPEQATEWHDLKPKERKTTENHRRKPYANRIEKQQNLTSTRKNPYLNIKKFGFNDSQEEELFTALKKETRRETRRVKRQKNKQDEKVCYNCREHGHSLSDCPQISKDVEQGTGICFKCGSTEHTSHTCKVRVKPGEFPYAKCFICGETGHLSKQCSDNPKGLYPMGGCCKECGSVEHYQKDCPEAQAKQGVESLKLQTINNYTSADAEDEMTVQPQIVKKKVPKLVKF